VAATIHLPEITLVSHHPTAKAMEKATFTIPEITLVSIHPMAEAMERATSEHPTGLGQVLSSFSLPHFAKLTQTVPYKQHIFFHPTISAAT
jgi:hypothetical protein